MKHLGHLRRAKHLAHPRTACDPRLSRGCQSNEKKGFVEFGGPLATRCRIGRRHAAVPGP